MEAVLIRKRFSKRPIAVAVMVLVVIASLVVAGLLAARGGTPSVEKIVTSTQSTGATSGYDDIRARHELRSEDQSTQSIGTTSGNDNLRARQELRSEDHPAGSASGSVHGN
jgi:hypothetical protein